MFEVRPYPHERQNTRDFLEIHAIFKNTQRNTFFSENTCFFARKHTFYKENTYSQTEQKMRKICVFTKSVCFLKNRAIFKKIVCFFLSCGRGLILSECLIDILIEYQLYLHRLLIRFPPQPSRTS